MQKPFKNKSSSSTKPPVDLLNNTTNTEKLQEKLTQKAYVHHNHGGREHGHGWDDIPKAERKVQSEHEGKKKVREQSRRAKETDRTVTSRQEE